MGTVGRTSAVTERGGRLVGPAQKSWVSVENLSAAVGMELGSHLYEANVFATSDIDLAIPDARPGDYVRVLTSDPVNRSRQHVMLQVREGAPGTKPRTLESQRQTFTLEEAEPGRLALRSTRRNPQFGAPFARAWFLDTKTSRIRSVVLDADGTLPADFRLDGDGSSRFRVAMTTKEVSTPPEFREYLLGAPVRSSASFDHRRMKRHRGPLFVDGVHWDDPIQGQLGNCWLVASLSAIARVRPEHIEDMIEPLDDGRYRVTFQRYDADAGAYVPDPVVVTPNFYRDLFRPAYGGSRNSGQRGRMELWFPIVEKAYAQLRGGYRATRSGTGVDAFERILGAPAKQLDHTLVEPKFLFTSLRDALQARLPLYTATPRDLSTIDARHRTVTEGLVANHAYTILDTYEEDGERYVRLRNPHGSGTPSGGARGVFALPLASFMATFDHSMIGTLPRSEPS